MTKFADFIKEVENEAKREGPHAVAELQAFRSHYALAQDLRNLRQQRGLTQHQLAASSGINQADISKIERGQVNPTTATVAALLAPLDAHLGIVRH